MFKNRVIVWIAIYWTVGIYASLFSAGEGRWLLILASFLFIGFILRFGMINGRQGLILLMVLFLSVGYHAWLSKLHQSSIDLEDGMEVRMRGTIQSRIIVDGDRLAFILKAIELAADDLHPVNISERVQVNIRLLTSEEQAKALMLQRGSLIEITGQLLIPPSATNWDAFDYRQYLLSQRIHWMLEARGLAGFDPGPVSRLKLSTWLGRFDRLQVQLGNRIEQLFRKELAGLMKSQTIGLRDDLDPEIYRKFAHVGLSHILAISGLHVGIFTGILLYVLRLSRMSRERCLLFTMAALPLYVLITGAAPPVIRAGLMALIGLEAARRKQLKDGLTILSGAVILMLLWNPYMLTSISFQLSVIVTLGLIVFVQPVSSLLPIRWQPLRGTMAVTIVAQLISFPMTIYYFNHFSLLSFLVNLIFVPILSLLVIPLTIFALLTSYIHLTVGVGLARIAEWITDRVLASIDMLIQFDPFGTIWASPPVWWIAMYYAMLAVCIRCLLEYHKVSIKPLTKQDMRRTKEKWMFLLTAASFGFCLLIILAYSPERWLNEAQVSFLDVGQGDAILVRTPQQRYILIDSGGTARFDKPGEEWKLRSDPYEVGKDTLVPLLKRRGVRKLDYLILTHLDHDHIGGALAVLQHIPVKSILFNGTLSDQESVYLLFHSALAQGIPLYPAESGRTLQVDRHTQLLFLHPRNSNAELKLIARQNDYSTVFLLCIFERCMLMTGDIEERSEVGLISWLTREGSEFWKEIQEKINRKTAGDDSSFWSLDLLKVAHHGSKTSTSDPWLDFWQPASAVISAGRHNFYGHPHSIVLNRLESRNIPIFRTDAQGEIRFIISPRGIKAKTKK